MGEEKGNSMFYFPGNLVEAFKIRNRILGKVDLQKTVYFMKRLGVSVPFNFRWNIFGPYSYELAHFCDHLVVEGLFRYTGRYILNEKKAEMYASNFSPRIRKRIEGFFRRVEETCSTHRYDSVRFIECVASLDFVLQNVSKERKRKEVVYSLLGALKPERAELFKTFREDAWNLLVNEDLVRLA